MYNRPSTPLIKDLMVGGTFTDHLIVKNVTRAIASNNSEYLRVTLSDKSGDLTAMIWDVTHNHFALEAFVTGNIVHVSGTITDYQGTKQLNMQSYRVAGDNDTLDMERLVKTAPIDAEDTFFTIVRDVQQFDNDVLKRITLKLLEDWQAPYKTMPAAKSVHHAYRSGLIYHTDSMLRHAKVIADLNQDLNKDLLFAGVILHDLGKVIEYSGEIATVKTLEGELKGHISVVSELIAQAAKDLNFDQGTDAEKEAVLLLQHVVLSHHGLASNGWGSPVSPLIIEAEILHQIDMMDAHLESYRNAAEDIEPGEFTGRIFGLDNRAFYKHNL